LEHWQLSEFEQLNHFPADYRVTQEIQDRCDTAMDLAKFLDRSYAQNVTAEFEHVGPEEEKVWLHENYQKFLNNPIEGKVTDSEKTKALLLLLRG